jgi:hypothetical protein
MTEQPEGTGEAQGPQGFGSAIRPPGSGPEIRPQDRDAAPARGVRNLVSGTRRAAVRSYYGEPPCGAGRGPDERGRKPAGQGETPVPVRSRKHGPEVTSRRRWSAARRAYPETGCASVVAARWQRTTTTLRLAALRLPSIMRGDETTTTANPAPPTTGAHPRARARERTMRMSGMTRTAVRPRCNRT